MKKLIALMFLAACNVQSIDDTLIPPTQPTKTVVEDPAKAKAEESAKKAQDEAAAPVAQDAPVVDPEPVIPPAILSFCIPHELRDVYSVAIPNSGALYAALVHDGVPNRLADPKCYLDHAIVTGGRRLIPCAVTPNGTAFGSGPLYGRMWAHVDRVWVEAALERQASLATLTAAEINVTIETPAAFSSDAALNGVEMVMISLDESVTFGGYCQ